MLATTRAAVLRGTPTEDEFGYPVDDNGGTVESWVEERRNFAPNPVPVTTASFSTVSFSMAAVADFPDDWADGIVDARRFTRTGSGAARISTTVGADMPNASAPITFRVRCRSSVAVPGVSIIARPAIASSSGQNTIETVTIPAGVSELMIAGSSFFAGTTVNSGLALVFLADAAHVGHWLDLTAFDIEAGDEFDDFFYFDTPDTPERRYSLDVATGSSIQEDLVTTIVDGSPVGLGDLPASITERARTIFDPTSGEPRTIRKITGRLPSYVQLEEGDRIRDNRTGIVYTIEESESQSRSISGRSSLSLDLKQVSP